MITEPFEGDANLRWVFDRYGWPLGAGALSVKLQEKRWWGWKTIEWNYAMGPGEIDFAKDVILSTPDIKRRKREEEAQELKATDDFLKGKQEDE